MAENDDTLKNEKQIKKGKSFILILIVAIIIIVAGVILYFSFFSESAMRDRKIKAYLASAEKYIDDLDYEKAIAEYEAAIKLNPELDDAIDGYVDAILNWAEDVAEDDIEKAIDILKDAIKFLEKNVDTDEYKKQIAKLQDKYDEYSDLMDEEDDSTEPGEDNDIDDAEEVEELDDTVDSAITLNGDYIVLGSYEQDGNDSNGAEPIEWEILGEDENGVLLVSRYVLDVYPYYNGDNEVTWEDSDLREWLNDDFYNEVFSEDEKSWIVLANIINSDNEYYGARGGNDTYDYVFCLSIDEMMTYYDHYYYYGDVEYDGWVEENMLQVDSPDFIATPTQYAKDNGLESYIFSSDMLENDYDYYSARGYSEDDIGREGADWWLRSPGYDNYMAAAIGSEGRTEMYFMYGGFSGADAYMTLGVRPAIYIKELP